VPPIISAFTRAVTAVSRAAFYLAALSIYAIVPVMLIDVAMRYVFNSPTVWAMELAVLIFGPYFLLAGPYVLHLKGHVAMDIIRQRLSPGAGRVLDLVNMPIIIAFAAILLWYSWPLAVDSWNYGETSFSAWNPPIWWAKAAVPLSLALMLAQALAEFLRLLFRDPGYEAVAS
jgi:TRAP-type C4-dicarboxylate transport system permease small subunit